MTDDPRVLVCRRRRLFRQIYDVVAGPQRLGTIEFKVPNPNFEVEGRAYVASKGSSGSTWSLATDDSVIASARRLQKSPLAIELEFDDRTWRIQPGKKSLLLFEISEQGGVIGRVEAKLGLISNRLEIDATFGGEIPMLVFTAWLIGMHWVGIVGTVGAARA